MLTQAPIGVTRPSSVPVPFQFRSSSIPAPFQAAEGGSPGLVKDLGDSDLKARSLALEWIAPCLDGTGGVIVSPAPWFKARICEGVEAHSDIQKLRHSDESWNSIFLLTTSLHDPNVPFTSIGGGNMGRYEFRECSR